MDINQEREHAYAGYEGMVTLAEELVRTLESPVWQHAKSQPPWSTKAEVEVLLTSAPEKREVTQGAAGLGKEVL
ncbi:nitrogenase FeMo-cofactor scaffold and assembly protein NifE [Vibrio astriarenae]|nr:nitrogenase FeMo-cofactor scaffold and assembly protein NifE [Vibrio sp. C7]